MDDDDASAVAGGDSGSMASNGFSFPNPGAVFDNVDDAASHALGVINPVSKAQNQEYDLLFYRDPSSGKIGYTDPIENGLRGSPETDLAAPGTILGMAHTHGDYTDGNWARSTQGEDAHDSDNFSGTIPPGNTQPPTYDPNSDMAFMRNNYPTWAYYLGTPSGQFLKWTHDKGLEDFN